MIYQPISDAHQGGSIHNQSAVPEMHPCLGKLGPTRAVQELQMQNATMTQLSLAVTKSTYRFHDAAATEGYVPATANANATTLRDSASTIAG